MFLYSEQSKSALSINEGNLYILWALIRSLHANARFVPISEIKGPWKQATLKLLLRKGNHKYWTLGKRSVWPHGYGRVNEYLDCYRSGWKQEWSLNQLQSKSRRRAALMATCISDKHPVSQRTVKEISGVAPSTQRKYRKDGACCTTTNVVDLPYDHILARDYAHLGVYLVGGRLRKRIPNTHIPAGTRMRLSRRERKVSVKKSSQFTYQVFFPKGAKSWSKKKRSQKLGTKPPTEQYPFPWAYYQDSKGKWRIISEPEFQEPWISYLSYLDGSDIPIRQRVATEDLYPAQ